MTFRLPAGFLDFARWQREGDAGAKWVAGLPEQVDRLCTRWRLRIDGETMHGDNGIVVPVSGERGPAVLKLSWQDDTTRWEAWALRLWDGDGAVRLFDHDAETGALLLERLGRGTSLADVELTEAAGIAGNLLRRLSVPAPDGLKRLSDLARSVGESLESRWAAQGRPFSRRLLTAVLSAAESAGRSTRGLLVHHDLHYRNILRGRGGRWLAIDPMVIAGDPEYQVGQLLWTRYDDIAGADGVPELFDIIIRAAGLDAALARDWTLIRCADYWLWGLGAGFDQDPARCAGVIAQLGYE